MVPVTNAGVNKFQSNNELLNNTIFLIPKNRHFWAHFSFFYLFQAGTWKENLVVHIIKTLPLRLLFKKRFHNEVSVFTPEQVI